MKLWLSSLSPKAPIKVVVAIGLNQNQDYTNNPTLLNFYVRSMNDSITFAPKVEVSPSGGNVSPYLCPMDWMERVRTPAAFASKQSNVVVSGKCILMVRDGQSGNQANTGHIYASQFSLWVPSRCHISIFAWIWNLRQTFSYCVEICDSNHTVLLRLLTSECLYRLKEWASTRGARVIECPFVQKGREMTYQWQTSPFYSQAQ